MKQIIRLIIIALLVTSAQLSAQIKLDSIHISGWYIGTMDQVLDKIGKEKGIVFKFNREAAKAINIDSPPFERSVESFVKYVICNGNKLKYYINKDDGAVYIISQWEKLAENNVKKAEVYKNIISKTDFNLSGTVVDGDSHESLPFVNVVIKGTSNGTSTNVDGYFTLLKVPTDTSSITFSYIGYKPKIVHLTPNFPIRKTVIELEPNTELLSEVVVMADKQDLLQTNEKVGMIKMTPLKMNTLPSLGEKDIFRTFQLMPGISAANENSSGLYVRGGTPDQSLVLYDGIPIYNVQHLFGFFSAFNSNAIKDIQLYKGGFDAKYGGRLSSVVEITGKDGNQKNFSTTAELSLMSANAFIETPIGKKITFLVAGRRSWQSPLYNLIYKQATSQSSATSGANNSSMPNPLGGRSPNTTSATSYFYDLNSKITYRPTQKDIISFSLYNGKDDLSNDFSPNIGGGPGGGGFSQLNTSNTDLTSWGNTGISMKWSRNWTNRLYANTLISYSDYYNDRTRTNKGHYYNSSSTLVSINSGSQENNRLEDYSAKIDLEYKLTNNNLFCFGLDHTFNNVKYSYIQNDTTTILNKDNKGTLSALYLQDKITFMKSKLEVSPGLRANYYSLTNQRYYEPRLTTSYNINKQFKLKGSAGKYYQFAKKVTREDIMQGNREFWMLSDGSQMPISSSVQYVAGVAYETKNYLFDMEAYYKRLDNISEYSIRFDQQVGGGPEMMSSNVTTTTNYENRFYSGKGYSRGIDFLLQKKYGNYTGWIGYTISETINNFDAFGGYDYYASNDVTNEFKVVNSFKWHNWDFSANWIFASGKPYTSPEGIYQLTLPDGTVKQYFNASIKNGNRLPDYHRLDIAATYNFKISELYPCTLNFSVFNLYNRKNVWYREFEIVESEVVRTDVNYLGILPNLNFSIKF
ncbi:MAG: TonB-dependent receptor [Bacteroidales bacterium]|nr:TonB-dependent receptor [Bacteroidales bacterium]